MLVGNHARGLTEKRGGARGVGGLPSRGGGGAGVGVWSWRGSLARGPRLAKTFSHAFALTLLLWPFFSDEHAESGNPVFLEEERTVEL